MDIYLLREGKEFGPFSEEATQSFLSQGAIVPEDLAWTPGRAAWGSLEEVLLAEADEEAAVDEAIVEETIVDEVLVEEAAAEPMGVEETFHSGEPATAKQKAFLNYLGIPNTPAMTKEYAAILLNEAMENPKLSARVAQWNGDRLRLHPELFAEEAQALREDRANRFCEVCAREGAEFFMEVKKEHCQVLITYLDVRFPNWDAHESEAAVDYFFPAVAEKFPQVVRKAWRGNLHYPEETRALAKVASRSASVRLQPGPVVRVSPLRALVRGIVGGLALLLLLYVGVQFFTGQPAEPAPASSDPKPERIAPDATPKFAKAESREETARPVASDPLPVAEDAPAATKPEPSASPEMASATPAGTPRTHVVIVKPFVVKLPPYGSAKIDTGTMLKIAAQNAREVTVIYNAQSVTIPLEYTDLAAP